MDSESHLRSILRSFVLDCLAARMTSFLEFFGCSKKQNSEGLPYGTTTSRFERKWTQKSNSLNFSTGNLRMDICCRVIFLECLPLSDVLE